MSSVDEVEQVERAVADPEVRRSALNPFDGCPWIDFANELTWGYMQDELDPWTPLGDHHQRWLEKFDSGDRVLLCHRDGLKTTITLAYLIACLEYKDGFRAVWAMNNRDSVTKKADTEFWRMVERNPWLTNLNGYRKKDTITAKEFPNESILNSGWLFGGIEGDRAHLLVLDDIVKEKGDGDVEDVLDWIEAVCVPMVKDGGRTVAIGTRKAVDDVYTNFRSHEGYDFEEWPAILDVWDQQFGEDDDWESRRPDPEYYTEVDNPWAEGETMQVLWPEARGPHWLAGKKSKMSDHRFWREYALVIRGSSGNLIDAGDVRVPVEDGGCSFTGQSPPPDYRPSEGEVTVVTHDPASSKTGDNAAFTAWLLNRAGERKLLAAHAEQGMKPSAVKALLKDLDRRYDPAVIVIENNGMQQYIEHDAIEFDAQLAAKVTGIPTTGQKHSWENGIPRLRALVENGKIHFYRGDSATEDFIQAMQSLELKDGRLKGHTPDYISAWFMAELGLRRLEDMGLLDPEDGEGEEEGGGVSYL